MTHLAFTPEMVVLALLAGSAAFVCVCWGIAMILHGPNPRGVNERDVRAWAREELAAKVKSIGDAVPRETSCDTSHE